MDLGTDLSAVVIGNETVGTVFSQHGVNPFHHLTGSAVIGCRQNLTVFDISAAVGCVGTLLRLRHVKIEPAQVALFDKLLKSPEVKILERTACLTDWHSVVSGVGNRNDRHVGTADPFIAELFERFGIAPGFMQLEVGQYTDPVVFSKCFVVISSRQIFTDKGIADIAAGLGDFAPAASPPDQEIFVFFVFEDRIEIL